MKLPSERTVFLLAGLTLAYFVGWGTRMFGWIPDDFLYTAVQQAHEVLDPSPPSFAGRRVFYRHGARTLRSEDVQPGLTLIASRWRDTDWAPEVRLIDRSGRTIHRWVLDPGTLFPDSVDRRPAWGRVAGRGLHGTHLTKEGDLLVNFNYLGTVRVDACGRVEWTLSAGNHHAVSAVGDGSYWIPGATAAMDPSSPRFPEGYPGIDHDVHHDLLLRVDGEGTVVDTLRVFDLLYRNGLERHLAKSGLDRGADLTHLNDVEPLPMALEQDFPSFDTGDLLVSLRFPDLVFVVDPETERVKWHASHPFIQQHDPDYLPGGWIGVFDNNRDGTSRGTMLGGSRIVRVRPHTDSVTVVFPTSRSPSIFTTIMGNWQLLPNGNLLLTESRAGRVLEVTSEGVPVWEWVHSPYGEERVPHISEAQRYDVTPQEVSAWSCTGDSIGEHSAGLTHE